ncbi:MAG: Hpt domain-containing protein [Chloroflexota bacterium]
MSLDPSALDSYREFMGEDAQAFIAEIIGSFVENAPTLLASAEQAMATGNQDTFVRAVHTLKSNSASLGATLLASLAAEMEQEGKAGNMKDMGGKLTQAKEELARVIEMLAGGQK